MTSTLKNLFVLLAFLGTLGLGYFVYFGNPELEDVSNSGAADVDLKAARFLARINDLKQIQLNGDILSDIRFGSLVDFSGEVSPEEIGRENPFDGT
jgi:hypothetical protein